MTSASAVIPSQRAPCVFVITDDFDTMVEVRVRIPFDAMFKAGLISGYHVQHRGRMVRSVGIPADIERVDAVWVQRVLVHGLLFVTDALDGRYIYDIDDNLLVVPSYQTSFSHTTREIVQALLRGARVVSSTSERLPDSLERRSGLPVRARAVVTPNLAELVDAPASAGDPAMLLLALSGHLPLTASHDAFIRGVSRFLERRSLPLLHVGPPLTDLSALGLNARSTGYLDYFTYRETIRRQNAIAIAPLEGRGDPDTQDFVRGKSDVKMVEFGSLGVPALYADVEPYRETELCCGPLADMGDESAIEEGLERVFRTAGEIKHKAEASVREHRLAIRRTAGSWFKAIEAGRLASPVALADLVKHAAGYAALATSAEEQLAILRRRRPTAPPRPDCQHDARRPTRAGTERSGPPAHNAAPPLFDAEFYLATYVDVRNSGLDPYRHYLERGIAERRNPNPFFETSWYVRRNPQAGLPGIDPLQHYLAAAGDPSVDPSPRFSTRLYCQRNPRLEGMHPLEHFLRRLRHG